ncbi:MAG: RES family NAD+ phosphorylase [Rariglobus sp.]
MASTSDPRSVRVWRLVKERHAENAFDGEGARLYGGRWNSPGHRVIYTSGSLALAALETLVHLDAALPLPRFLAFSVQVAPEDIVAAQLPATYSFKGSLPDLGETRRLGDEWLAAGDHLALSVPSAIVPQESNLLLNPLHPRFSSLLIAAPVAFAVDGRLRR